jgi:hypothetical protein
MCLTMTITLEPTDDFPWKLLPGLKLIVAQLVRIFSLLWSPMINFHISKGPQVALIRSEMNSVQFVTPSEDILI